MSAVGVFAGIFIQGYQLDNIDFTHGLKAVSYTHLDVYKRQVITRDFVAGEYVWTGFDYIGEPTPWNGTYPGEQSTANFETNPKNSYFGIVDTAGFPKDSYYFYQSQWNDKVNTLHVLPTWNKDSIKLENGKAEVVVYSDAAKVELKLNGQSLGTKEFETQTTGAGYTYQTVKGESKNHKSLYMTWEVPYQEGTLEAIAYDKNGNKIEKTQGRSVDVYKRQQMHL